MAMLGGAAVDWPLAARAQVTGRPRLIGVLSSQSESDPEPRSWIEAFSTRLQELGWKDGDNIRIAYRWAEGQDSRLPLLAKELVGLQPDVLLGAATSASTALRQYTLAIPIVFAQVADPVAAGLVTNLARPEGNLTGFTSFEFSIGGKWLQLLKECAPAVARVIVVFDPENRVWPEYLRSIEAAAPSLGMRLTPASVHGDTEIERAFDEVAKEPNGAAIVLPSVVTVRRREKLIALAVQYRLPAMYPYSFFVVGGGLMSYGIDVPDLYRRAASYADRILKGEKPAGMPVQQPTKLVLAINLKTATALGVTVPPILIATADQVIE
ncbi:MAG TPA: ABC transporter substrate-binding protein [Stellaceae bacterium]|nr:ABC transporter substrate-binding protein [Stellaceae bacterium]